MISVTKQRLILPFYHAVSNEDLMHIKHLYKIRNQQEFIRDLDFFLKYFHPIDYQSLLDHLKNGKELRENSILLSFDDGLRQFHDIIAPILLQKGIPAICFLNSDFIDNRDLFFRYKASILIEKILKGQNKNLNNNELKKWLITKNVSGEGNVKDILKIGYGNQNILNELASLISFNFNEYLNLYKPYLTSTQIVDLKEKGFHFGSHSEDHPLFSELAIPDQIKQVQTSLDLICNKFKLDYKLFSFPFTDDGVSKSFFETIFDPQNPVADITFGCAGLKRDCISNNIQRIPIEISAFPAKEVVKSAYVYFILKAFFNKNLIKRQL
jgi:peptidoglycan/xylan/chitin deacetylase (PgdA/CDA1 family)